MKTDYWGFPVVDWSLAPKKRRLKFADIKGGDAAEGNYLGHPSVLGHVLMITGEREIIGVAATLYSYEDFKAAAGMSFDEYMAAAGLVASEHLTRVQHAAIRGTSEWTITYTTKDDPFSFKSLAVRALDAVGAENYANFVFAVKGNTIMSVEPKSIDVTK